MIPQKNTIKTQMWHSHSIEEVVQILQTDLSKGLTHDEVRERLKHYCPNELKEMPRPGFLRMIIDQFNNFLVLLLVVASVVSFFLGEYLDASAILAIVVLNAVLGVVQESKAEKALAALREIAAPDARVLRDGSVLTTSVREIVPGDVVLLDTGNYVPADVRLVETHNLRINESSLTGESVPVEKKADEVLTGDIPIGDRNNLAYMSTLVTYGRGKGVVIATGMDTQFGMIAEMIQEYKAEPTPLQVRLDQLGKWLGIAALAVCGVVFVMGVMRGLEILEMFLTAVSLAIAAVPEGLPAVVTICLALGMQHMIGKNALVRKLTAVETLGSTTVICSDKTG
ncbi:MAG: HAD-IC family P-type ATPase, partial [Thermodesulfobacteriota bacterium]|nr:HAD-IC family P-type ATPase [Thermodesulfobacteriota bacterium]